jgi:hypothetical protein
MVEQPKSAAAALYPHLPSADPEPRGRAQSVSLAHSMYPSLTAKPPPGWRSDDIAVIRRAFGQGQSDAEVARRYGVSKQVVGQIRKLGR